MLDNMRRQGASIFIYLIFGILIAVFVINFRPGGNKGDGGAGCTGTTNTVVSVEGASANQTAYHVAYSSPTNQYQGRQRVYYALEMLIRRELLASAAADHGIAVDGDMVDEAIKRGYFFLGGQRIDLGQHIFDEYEDGTKTWNLKKYRAWVNQLNVSLGSYRDEQTRSMQAAMMADLLKSDVRVSREEALASYIYDNTTATYDVVTFMPGQYRSAMRLTDADIQRFLTTHEDQVQAKFKADERTYKGTKPALHLRQIFIAKAEAAKPDDKKPDDKKPDDKKDDKKADDKKADKTAKADAKKSAGLPIEEAKAKLEAARASIAASKLAFGDAAKELASEEADRANRGDLGWHSIETPALSEKAVNDAVKPLKPGEMTPVITTDRGAYLLIAEAKREGDLDYNAVKADIAALLAKDVWSKEAAKQAALTALATARAGKGKNLDEMFEKAPEAPHNPGGPGMQMPDLKKMSPADRQRFLEQLQRQMQQGQHGALEVESKDQPAGWFADKDGAGTAEAPAGSAAPAAGSAAPAAGSAAPAAGSAAPAAGSPATPTAPATSPEPVASTDVLPAFGDVTAPKVEHHGPAPRTTKMEGIGVSKEAATALFEELSPGMLAKRVYETDTGYVVVQLITKGDPKVDDFDKRADEEISALRNSRAAAMIDEWLKARCEAASKAGKIKPLQELLRESDDKGQPLPEVYKPCMSMH